MRGLGTVLLAGAAVVVLWKILAVFFFGLVGLALKVGMVILVVWLVMQLFRLGKKEDA